MSDEPKWLIEQEIKALETYLSYLQSLTALPPEFSGPYSFTADKIIDNLAEAIVHVSADLVDARNRLDNLED